MSSISYVTEFGAVNIETPVFVDIEGSTWQAVDFDPSPRIKAYIQQQWEQEIDPVEIDLKPLLIDLLMERYGSFVAGFRIEGEPMIVRISEW